MDIDILRKTYKKDILDIAQNCNAEYIKIFGSFATKTQNKNSDVDFLVHMKPGSGFCIGGLKWKLEELLHMKVDIVPDTALHWSIREQVIREAINI